MNIDDVTREDVEFFDEESLPLVEKRPFISDKTKHFILTILYSPVYTFFWLLSRVVIAFSGIVTLIKVRIKPYNPEKLTCPGCGYKGEKGSDWRTCTVAHVQVEEPKRGMNQHTCLRCQAKFLTDLFSPGREWLPPVIDPRIAAMQRERTRVI